MACPTPQELRPLTELQEPLLRQVVVDAVPKAKSPLSYLQAVNKALEERASRWTHFIDRFSGLYIFDSKVENQGNPTALSQSYRTTSLSGFSSLSYFYKFGFGAFSWTLFASLVNKHLQYLCIHGDNCWQVALDNIVVGTGGTLGAAAGFLLWAWIHDGNSTRQHLRRLFLTALNLVPIVLSFDAMWKTASEYPIDVAGEGFAGWMLKLGAFCATSVISMAVHLICTYPARKSSGYIPFSWELLSSFTLGGYGFSMGSAVSKLALFKQAVVNAGFTGLAALAPSFIVWRQKQSEFAHLSNLLSLLYSTVPRAPKPGEHFDGKFHKGHVMSYLKYSLARLNQKDRHACIGVLEETLKGSQLLAALHQEANHAFSQERQDIADRLATQKADESMSRGVEIQVHSSQSPLSWYIHRGAAVGGNLRLGLVGTDDSPTPESGRPKNPTSHLKAATLWQAAAHKVKAEQHADDAKDGPL